MKGVLAGALALVALQVLVTSSNGTGLSALAALPGAWARKFLDPTIPAFGGGGTVSPAPSKTATPATSSSPSTIPSPSAVKIRIPSIL